MLFKPGVLLLQPKAIDFSAWAMREYCVRQLVGLSKTAAAV